MEPQKIAAYRVDNGAKVWIPEHWLTHPKLGRQFRKTPRQKAADIQKAPADGDNTKKEK